MASVLGGAGRLLFGGLGNPLLGGAPVPFDPVSDSPSSGGIGGNLPLPRKRASAGDILSGRRGGLIGGLIGGL